MSVINLYYVKMESPPARTMFKDKNQLIGYLTRQGYPKVRSDFMAAHEAGVYDYFVTEALYKANNGHQPQVRLLFSCCIKCLAKKTENLKSCGIQPRQTPCPPCKKEI